MTTAVHLDFKGQAPGLLLAPSGRPWGIARPWLGVQHLAEVELLAVYLALESVAVWPHKEPCALEDSQEFSVGAGLGLGDREARDWERLAPLLAGTVWGGEVAWLSTGPPGG